MLHPITSHEVSGKNVEQKLEGFDAPQLIKWLAWILLAAVVGFMVVLGAYWIFFDGKIVADHQRWGTFGDFVGGVLNPFLGFLTILALLVTIVLQNRQLEVSMRELVASRKELELTREELAKTAAASQKQAEHFEGEAKRADLLRLIEKLGERINKNYNENRLNDMSSLHRIMRGNRDPSNNPDLRNLLFYYQDKTSPTYNTIRWIEGDLARLKEYMCKYEQVSKYGGTPIPNFYLAEFGEMVRLLHRHQLLSAELFGYYCKDEDIASNSRFETS